jgi:hypothetical protein
MSRKIRSIPVLFVLVAPFAGAAHPLPLDPTAGPPASQTFASSLWGWLAALFGASDAPDLEDTGGGGASAAAQQPTTQDPLGFLVPLPLNDGSHMDPNG